MAVVGSKLYLHHAAETGSNPTATYEDADDVLVNALDQTTTANMGTGGNVTLQLLPGRPGTTTTVPTAGTNPTGKGWRVTPTSGTLRGMNDDAAWSRSLVAGVWNFQVQLIQNSALATGTYTFTVIFFKMTSLTAGTEIGRCSPSGSSLTPANSLVLTAATPSLGAQTFANGATIGIEIYITGPGVAITGDTMNMPLDNGATDTGQTFLTLPGSLTATISKTGALSGAGAIAGIKRPLVNKAGKVASATALSGVRTTLLPPKLGNIASAIAMSGSKTTLVSKGGTITSAAAISGTKRELVNKAGSIAAAAALSGGKYPAISKAGNLKVDGSAISGIKRPLVSKSGSIASSSALAGAKKVLVSKAGSIASSATLRGDERVYTFNITGITRDKNGTPVPGMQTDLYRTSDGARIGRLTSDGAAQFVFTPLPGDTTQYWLRTWKAGTPNNIFGTSDQDLVVATSQVQGPP